MAAKRSNKRRRKHRHFGLLYQMISLVIIVAVVLVGCGIFFRVGRVEVLGATTYTPDEVVAATGVKLGDSLVFMGKDSISLRVLRGLPYIEEVALRRGLPDLLTVEVTECAVAGEVSDGTNWWLISAGGKVLGTEAERGISAPKITGLTALLPAAGTHLAVDETQSGNLSSLLALTSALEELDMLARVDGVNLDAQEAIVTLKLDARFSVKLPLHTDFPYKMRALETLIAQLQPNEKGAIDLTRDKNAYFTPET